jgi:hypothetical protein
LMPCTRPVLTIRVGWHGRWTDTISSVFPLVPNA